MGHICSYYGSIKVGKINNVLQPYIEIEACWKKKSEIVYREAEDGYCESRYIYNSSCAGYVVTFPHEKSTSWYYGYGIQEESKFWKCDHMNIPAMWLYQKEDLKELEQYNFGYPYLNKKYRGDNIWTYMNLRRRYKENPNIERLVEVGQTHIACDKRLSKLSKEKRTQVLNFIKDNPDCHSITHALFCIKYKVPYKDIGRYASTHYNYDLTNYLAKQNENVFYYRDYIKICKDLGFNIDDPYWKYPSKLRERHNSLLADYENYKKMKEEKDFAAMNDKLKKISKKYQMKNIENCIVYVPDSYSEIKNQAEDLHQCLIACSYYKKMADGKSLLIFIKSDDEKRLATAEIGQEKKILQFYGDESNRNDCKPSEQLHHVLNTYLSQI